MLRKHCLLILLIFTTTLFAAGEKEVDSEIKHVTVFLNGAQVTRNFNATLKTGVQVFKIKELSPYLDAKTIQVKGNGEFTIISLRHQLNYLDEKKKSAEINKLMDSLNFYQRQTTDLNTEFSVLNESEAFLKNNQILKGNNSNLDIATLKGAHQYFAGEILTIRRKKNDISYAISKLNEHLNRIRNQLNEVNKELAKFSSEILIEVQSDKPMNGEFQLSYLVNNASWYPSYDVRVTDINSPLAVIYKANVQQTTGEDWNNVLLTFSNANPYQSGDLPILKPYYLNYTSGSYSSNPYKSASTQNSYNLNNYISSNTGQAAGRVLDATGQPVSFAMIRVQGTSVGTITDENGNFTLTLPQGKNQVRVSYIGYEDAYQNLNTAVNNTITMQEQESNLGSVVVANKRRSDNYFVDGVATESYSWSFGGKRKYDSKPIAVLPLENQTTLELSLEIPFTLKSEGKQKVIAINQIEMPAYYEYRSVPKLEESAFLIARISDWGEYNLLEGEANLYFENTYIGKSILDVRYLTDTLNISLGRDKNVLIKRQKVKSQTTREFIGNDNIEKRQFDITVRNNKKQAINIIVYDQVPISQQPKDIEVTLRDKSGAVNDETTGELKWEFNLETSKTNQVTIKYQVKFPKNKQINLE